jgi:CheY-like chemotaxis protein
MLLGHQVRGVSSAEAAFDVLAEDRFDILLTDVSLPGISGIEFARKAITELPALKVIFSSGYGVIAERDLGFKAASLPKPYDLGMLQQVLSDIGSRE